jgi:hypothetical protein
MTSTVDVKDETRPRPIQKAKVNVLPHGQWLCIFQVYLLDSFLIYSYNAQIEILLGKTDKFDELMAAAAEEREANEAEEQS